MRLVYCLYRKKNLGTYGQKEMQAACKAIRKQSLCGSKPGGAAAYNLRESCVKKDRAPTQATESIKKKIKVLLTFYLKEKKKIGDRIADIADQNHVLPPNFKAGQELDIISMFVRDAKSSQDTTVRARVKKAIDERNAKLRPQIAMTHGFEMLVLKGALTHYTQAIVDIAT